MKDTVAQSRGYAVIRLWESQLNTDKSLIINILKTLQSDANF